MTHHSQRNGLRKRLQSLRKSFLGALVFYTLLPLPKSWQIDLTQIARWSPWIGLLLGAGLGLCDMAFSVLAFPRLIRSALVVTLWVYLTGGLHLDGAMDAADGLAVTNPQRRLEVMKDSTTGAFGVMVAVLIIILKTAALSEIPVHRGLGLMLAAGWGRWGQVVAIAFYPYLRHTGKGAFHQQTLRLPQDILGGLIGLLAISGVLAILEPSYWYRGIAIAVTGASLAIITGFWFYRQFGGHTGDTYGAIVEWTETLLLCLLPCLLTI